MPCSIAADEWPGRLSEFFVFSIIHALAPGQPAHGLAIALRSLTRIVAPDSDSGSVLTCVQKPQQGESGLYRGAGQRRPAPEIEGWECPKNARLLRLKGLVPGKPQRETAGIDGVRKVAFQRQRFSLDQAGNDFRAERSPYKSARS